MTPACDMNCLNCVFPDCINNSAPATLAERKQLRSIEAEITADGRKKRAYQRDTKRAYRAAHQEEIRAYQRAYQAAHQEEIQAYRAAHQEEIRAYQRAYQRAHYAALRGQLSQGRKSKEGDADNGRP